jgi:hypothetical protein
MHQYCTLLILTIYHLYMGTVNIFKNSAKSRYWCYKLISVPIGATAVQKTGEVLLILYTIGGNNLVIPVVPVVPFVPASGRFGLRSSCSIILDFRSFQVNSTSSMLIVQQFAARCLFIMPSPINYTVHRGNDLPHSHPL